MDSEDHEGVREFLEICTNSEKDWKSFLSICAEAFEESTPFRRSHPDLEKRRRFLPAYFKHLYETEYSGGRAGLACVKRQAGNSAPEIIYGLVGVYEGSPQNPPDKSEMEKIDPKGMEITTAEDEWVQFHVRDKIARLAKELKFTWIYFPLQAARSKNGGKGTAYIKKAAELIGFDGFESGKLPLQTPVIAYAVVDDVTLLRFYARIGMGEVARYVVDANGNPHCRNVNGIGDDTEEDNCLIIAAKGYPDAKFLIKELADYFSSHTPEVTGMR